MLPACAKPFCAVLVLWMCSAVAAGQDATAKAAAASSPAPAAPSPAAAAAAADYPQRYPNARYIDALIERSAHRSLGYALGRHGDGLVVGLRFDQPVTRSGRYYFSFYHYTNLGPLRGPFDPVLQQGFNFIMRTPIILGIFRVYYGGGGFVGVRPRPTCRNAVDWHDIGRAYSDAGRQAPLDPRTSLPLAPARNAKGELFDPTLAPVADQLTRIDEHCHEQEQAVTVSGSGIGGFELFLSEKRSYFVEVSGGAGAQKNGRWSDAGLIIHVGSQFYF